MGNIHEFDEVIKLLFDDFSYLIIDLPGHGKTQVLDDLENAGFIISFKPWWHSKKGIYYKVIDEYSLFYKQLRNSGLLAS